MRHEKLSKTLILSFHLACYSPSNNQMQKSGAKVANPALSSLPASDLERWVTTMLALWWVTDG